MSVKENKQQEVVKEEKSYEAPTVVYESEIQTRAGNSSGGGPLLDPSIDVEGIFND